MGVDLMSVAEELDRGHTRRRAVDVGADAAPAEGIQVAAVLVAFCEVDVLSAALVDDVAEQLVETDELVVANDGLDVPVAESAARPADCDRHAALGDEGLAFLDRVDGGARGRRDVDPEVEALRVPVPVARVVQVRPDRVLPTEGLDGPAIRGAQRMAVSDCAVLREARSCRARSGSGLSAGADRAEQG
jgi:hypothetical protein